ncbi:hypothetical protein [Flavobacterium sp. 270]|uniref:hypothetical protein n=1 Tax=Flavobacterium sp. 270 TaxID=2512114 RepID=UPI001066EE7C|nr:hypothetical protein [Flavobacterium sp. 270]
MKKYFSSLNIVLLLWFLIYILISNIYSDYTMYYFYLSLPIIILILIFDLVKQKKEDKLNHTNSFSSSIYRMLIMAVLLGVFFFITKHDHI